MEIMSDDDSSSVESLVDIKPALIGEDGEEDDEWVDGSVSSDVGSLVVGVVGGSQAGNSQHDFDDDEEEEGIDDEGIDELERCHENENDDQQQGEFYCYESLSVVVLRGRRCRHDKSLNVS